MDNDTIFTKAFTDLLKNFGTKPVKTTIKTPNMNAYIERYFLTFKTEALKWLIPQSKLQFRGVVGEWLKYYNSERNHQGINEHIIKPNDDVGSKFGKIKCRSRLGNTLNYYYRSAA
jgi:putative transposase